MCQLTLQCGSPVPEGQTESPPVRCGSVFAPTGLLTNPLTHNRRVPPHYVSGRSLGRRPAASTAFPIARHRDVPRGTSTVSQGASPSRAASRCAVSSGRVRLSMDAGAGAPTVWPLPDLRPARRGRRPRHAAGAPLQDRRRGPGRDRLGRAGQPQAGETLAQARRRRGRLPVPLPRQGRDGPRRPAAGPGGAHLQAHGAQGRPAGPPTRRTRRTGSRRTSRPASRTGSRRTRRRRRPSPGSGPRPPTGCRCAP